MNQKLIKLIFLQSLIFICYSCVNKDNISLYLGQEPPGSTPKLFAPGIVSTEEHHEFSCTLSPNGKEFYFNRVMQIMVCKWEEGSWTAPKPVEFTGNYRAHEPYITHDNKYLYFGSIRPNPDFPEEKQPYGIWRVERTRQGWSNPSYVGLGMYVTMTRNNLIYLTDIRGKDHYEQGIAKTTLINDHFGELIRQKGGVVKPAQDRRPGRHPFISPDESFIIFDSYEKETGKNGKLFICFKESDDLWGHAIKLNDKINKDNKIIAAYISPDGKYLFYSSDGDIYWVSTSFIEELKTEYNDNN
jgi:hypothetical protein